MYLVGEGVEKDPETAKNLMKFIEEEEKKLKGNENQSVWEETNEYPSLSCSLSSASSSFP